MKSDPPSPVIIKAAVTRRVHMVHREADTSEGSALLFPGHLGNLAESGLGSHRGRQALCLTDSLGNDALSSQDWTLWAFLQL